MSSANVLSNRNGSPRSHTRTRPSLWRLVGHRYCRDLRRRSEDARFSRALCAGERSCRHRCREGGSCDLGCRSISCWRVGHRVGGRLRLIAVIEDARVIRRILGHLGLLTEAPAVRPVRPPQSVFDAVALVIPVIEPAFRADTMAPARGADRGATGGRATRRRAIRAATITRRADREEAVAAPAGFLAKRRVHGAGAAGRSGWTSSPNRGTRERTASACRSLRRSRGSGGSVRVLPRVLSLRDRRREQHQRSGRGRCRVCGRTERAHKPLGKPHRTVSHTAHTQYF